MGGVFVLPVETSGVQHPQRASSAITDMTNTLSGADVLQYRITAGRAAIRSYGERSSEVERLESALTKAHTAIISCTVNAEVAGSSPAVRLISNMHKYTCTTLYNIILVSVYKIWYNVSMEVVCMDKQNPATKAKNKYNARVYDQLRILVPKGKKDIIKQAAAKVGESINSFVNKAIDTRLKGGDKDV